LESVSIDDSLISRRKDALASAIKLLGRGSFGTTFLKKGFPPEKNLLFGVN
jgi:hypothetical protein